MSLLRAHTPRHAKPSKTAPLLAAGGLTATFGAATSGSAEAATSSEFARLRMCESGGNYGINTGNGYYGAYQFDVRTWRGLGYSGLPSNAAPGTQDAAAQQLQAQRGWQPWPACSRKLGLGRSAPQAVSTEQTRTPVRASRAAARPVTRSVLFTKPSSRAVRPTSAPAFEGTLLSTALVKQNRADVRRWQHRMAARGWDVTVDGRFGPQSAAVAARFAAEKGLRIAPGTVNHVLWDAAWELPVS